jgi:chromate reductase
MANLKIAVIVGSNRRESINRKLANALAHLGKGMADFHFAEIADLPMFNQDNEGTPPAGVTCFKAEIEAADGLLIVTPEHNRSMPAVLKNAIDWGTRPRGQNNWAGKPVAITGTSQGLISTAVAQQHLRQVIGDLGALVMGGEAYINFKPDFLDAAGHIANEDSRKFLLGFLERFLALVIRLKD